ncbi:MAG: ABC transporter permease [Bacteroidota bacterium]
MLQNYFTTALRNLIRHRVFSLINILGLAVGMATCLLIFRYVSFEFSYDQFHPKGQDLYKVHFDNFRAGELNDRSTYTPYQLGPSLQEEVPEITEYIRWHPFYGSAILTHVPDQGERVQSSESSLAFVDPYFLEAMGFGLELGDPASALSTPKHMVISRPMADKYFGTNSDPIGKVIQINGGWTSGDYQISGVFAPMATNSHLSFDFLMPMEDVLAGRQYRENDGWGWYNFQTYVELIPGADTTEVMKKMDDMFVRQAGDENEARNEHSYPKLQAVTDIHLYTTPNDEPTTEGRSATLYFFILIGGFILVIAWVNYINLSTARAMVRAKEVGIRKTIGANRGQLIRQFLLESSLVNGLAMMLGLGLAWLLLPTLSDLVGKDLSLGTQTQPAFWLGLIALFVGGALLSGLYPALILSGFQPIRVLKGQADQVAFGVSLRKVLVVVQFAASAFLIASTIAVYQQVSAMKQEDIGMKLDQVLVVRGPGIFDREQEFSPILKTFKTKAMQDANVYAVASSAAIPGGGHNWGTRMRKLGTTEEEMEGGKIVWVDPDFVPTYEMQVLSGRAFSEEYGTDNEGLMINETALNTFELGTPEEALMEQLIVGGDTMQIQAVLKDFAWGSLQQEREAFMLAMTEGSSSHFSFRISPEKIPSTLTHIELIYRELFPGNPFEYHFQDEFFDRQYQEDQRFGNIFGMFTLLAIFIGCLGLFGLASFSATLRIKEIGVRKVLGASVAQLLALLSREYLLLVLIGGIVGLAPAYWYIQQWLEQYAFQITLGVWFFGLPLLFLGVVALSAVGYQTLKAAQSHPIKALRYE